jgi:acyl-CoA thioesterase
MTGIDDFTSVLALRRIGEGAFEANSLPAPGGATVVFGGQILAQCIAAAEQAQADKEVLSLHTVFSRGASTEALLDITVDTIAAGRAFGSVTVTVAQGGKVCARSLVLLHDPGPDLIRHAEAPPAVTPAEEIEARPGMHDWWDIRIVDGVDISDPDAVGPPELAVWTRFPGAPADPTTARALLAYASDGFLIGTAMRPHAGVGQSMAHRTISTTVLAQTITFHERFDASEWLLMDQRSTYAGRGRSQGTAEVYDAHGAMVASFGQVSMIRDFPQGSAPAAGGTSAH